MRITVELTNKEFEESDFETIGQIKEFIYEDLDQARDYPGYTVEVIVTDK